MITFFFSIYLRGVSGWWAGRAIAHPDFDRIEGPAGQRLRASLLLAHPVLVRKQFTSMYLILFGTQHHIYFFSIKKTCEIKVLRECIATSKHLWPHFAVLHMSRGRLKERANFLNFFENKQNGEKSRMLLDASSILLQNLTPTHVNFLRTLTKC